MVADKVEIQTLSYQEGAEPARWICDGSTEFEITEEAIQKGNVFKLAEKNADGKQLYLVKIPVNTEDLYGMRDMANQFLLVH